jgi:hypothetical protein
MSEKFALIPQVVRLLVEQGSIGYGTLAVYVAIAEECGPGPSCTLSQSRLAQMIHMRRQNLHHHLEVLREKGLLYYEAYSGVTRFEPLKVSRQQGRSDSLAGQIGPSREADVPRQRDSRNGTRGGVTPAGQQVSRQQVRSAYPVSRQQVRSDLPALHDLKRDQERDQERDEDDLFSSSGDTPDTPALPDCITWAMAYESDWWPEWRDQDARVKRWLDRVVDVLHAGSQHPDWGHRLIRDHTGGWRLEPDPDYQWFKP